MTSAHEHPAGGDAPARPTSPLLLLRAPSANRVYADAAGPLAVREAVRVLEAHLGVPVTARERRIAGVDHLELRADADPGELARIAATLSSPFAAFEPVDGPVADPVDDSDEGPDPLLRPVALPDPHRYGSDLETTLRYPGKTNEQFTALLLNLAAAASERRAGLLDGTLRVLDPMCGRGSTLSRALRLGLSATGADIDKADIEAYRAFLLTWMRTHRLKHTSDSGRLASHGTVLGTRFVAELAPDKEARRAGRTQRLELLRCDTTRLGDALGSAGVDALVADLPYGVQHGARTGGALARSPLATLAEALPVWRGLLRRDGGMALALNRRTAPFDDAARTLEAAGFAVVSADGEFRHRVDQSIDRDVLVAVRTDHPRADLLRAGFAGAVAPSEERNRS
ncbi:TRM11 family SAM-dependent methyltransferase [Brachybacterium huguangmaarense]